MKRYDRQTKTWLEEEQVKKSNKKRKLCKGGREHDWMLCLPSYKAHHKTSYGFDVAEAYYKIEDAREDKEVEFDLQLEELGIAGMGMRLSRLFGRRRSYVCTVCLKRK